MIAATKYVKDEKIARPGIYSGLSLDQYHHEPEIFDGPSISKSPLKWLLPAHGGSPKAFWGRWAFNPDHIRTETTPEMDFGQAVHCLLLGDEVFSKRFVIRPDKFPSYTTKDARDWRDAEIKAGKTIVLPSQIETIRRMAADAGQYPLIQLGILNGDIEQTICWKDKETGIWLKIRPDARAVDGIFADLKSAGKFDEDFLERQIFDAGYYLQGAMTRMVCRELGIPFESFVLVYVLNDDIPDTTHVEISPHELDRGERAIRWSLRTIRRCLDAKEWPGARPFDGGGRQIQMKPWAKEKLDRFLDAEERVAA